MMKPGIYCRILVHLFCKKYERYQQTDKRSNIQRYFKLFNAKFLWLDGKKQPAAALLQDINNNSLLDTASEKLFVARLYESLCRVYKKNNDNNRYNNYCEGLLEVYPQLVPFTELQANMQLSVSGIDDATTRKVTSDIEACNINRDANNSYTSMAAVYFEKEAALTRQQ